MTKMKHLNIHLVKHLNIHLVYTQCINAFFQLPVFKTAPTMLGSLV